MMLKLRATIFTLDINPCIDVPQRIVAQLLKRAGKPKGPIPVRGLLNGKKFTQTVVRYRGEWRLYLNTKMRKDAGIDVGDVVRVQLEFDREPRSERMNPYLARTFSKHKRAKKIFGKLTHSRRKEILRYLNSLKSDEAVKRNVEKILTSLTKD